ncbi:LOW QUALITY PROTEIN: phospholipase ABHD3 [Manduca sexta]|uniref:LOW QUALITY PROTEIN: phospholipase ABHD3 n=1 Tax=Manduca sexta TaxID=7130 RepID=UPI00188FDB11|nr:LOW QUALITY PROTEIN: phospholipase ABHD3 [Manduca sexta]
MLSLFMYILEVKKELLVGFSLSVLYITYYLVEVVKKPLLVCGEVEFREFLQENVPLLGERYWPTPWCVESRLQTVLGSLLRSSLWPPVVYRREVLVLSDGGQVALDWVEPEAWEVQEPRAVLLVLPGLTGSVHADYVRCLAAAARKLSARCVVFNNRGLGGLPLTTPRLYCAVSHDDLAEVVRAVRSRCGDAPLLAAGVSLGGLILGHYLAAQGDRSLVHGALVVSSPLDVVKGSEYMERVTLNAPLSYHMARNLRNTVRAHAPLRALACDWGGVDRARSVRQFDAAFTAQHFGFGSVEAYYRAATLRDKLERVRVPLLCLCAADDPFQPLDAIPLREAERAQRVALAVTARGGHIGFLEGWWPARAAPHQYMSRLAEQYFAALLARPELLHAAPAPTP